MTTQTVAVPHDVKDWTAVRQRWAARTPTELRIRCEELGGREWLVDGLFPARSLGIVVGASGLGKSPLLYQLSLCVASGRPFLGRDVRQGRVLYLDHENGVGQVHEILDSLSQHVHLDALPNDLLLWNLNDAAEDFGKKEHGTIDMIRELEPALVVIDSLGSWMPQMEEKNSNTSLAYRGLRKVMSDCGTSVIAVHHLKKPSMESGTNRGSLEEESCRPWFHQARGASALITGSDVRIGVDEPRKSRSGVNWLGEPLAEPASDNRIQSEAAALVMRGFARISGETPLTYLARVYDENGDPLGYEPLAGPDLLSDPHQREKFDKLPPTFRFKDAQRIYDRAAQATTDFLKKCIGLGILRKRTGAYEKIETSGVSGVK